MDLQQIFRKLGIENLNDMQRQTADMLLHRSNDVVVLSATGSGKTLAYLLPLVQMLRADVGEVQAVVIVPGRELALQQHEVMQRMGCGLRSLALYGGRPTMDEHRELKKVCPQLVFATPGRLLDHLEKGNISAKAVRFLIIDEFDKCLQMGFRKEMAATVASLPWVKQRVLLSATDAEEIPDFVGADNTIRLDFLDDAQVPGRIQLYVAKSEEKDKLGALARMLSALGSDSTMVFVNFRESVERVSAYLRNMGFVVASLHGGMEQAEREDAVFCFSNGSANVMVGTDLASRGLDIPQVAHIIHYHLPVGADEYVHRVGRTGRWTYTGKAFFLLGPDETLPEYVKEPTSCFDIPEAMGSVPKPQRVILYIGKGKKDKISRGDVLGFLCKSGGLKGSEIGRIVVKERCAYAAVDGNKCKEVLKRLSGVKMKGLKTVIEVKK